jgi:hypothetical protein
MKSVVALVLVLAVASSCTTRDVLAAQIRVGALQIFPPAANTIAASAEALTSALQSTVGSSEYGLINTPEFLFTPNLQFSAPGSCSGTGTNASGVLAAKYCFAVQRTGESLGCADGLPLESPARRVGCHPYLLNHSTMAVSINVCELARNGSLYNTQMLLRGGKVAGVYRKYHPFFTNCFSKPALELVTFDVQGARFGVFTCFDIVFNDPKMDLVKMGVKLFSYSMAMPTLGSDAVKLFSWTSQVSLVYSNADAGQTSIIVNGAVKSNTCPSTQTTCLASAVLDVK